MTTELGYIPFPGTWHVQCLEHSVNEYHRDKAAAVAARELHEIAAHQEAATAFLDSHFEVVVIGR